MNFCVLNEVSLLISLIDSIVNSLQLFHSLNKIILGWQGGARADHKSAGGSKPPSSRSWRTGCCSILVYKK